VELLTGIEGASSRPVRRIVLIGWSHPMRSEEVTLLVIIAATLTVIVIWFRNPVRWVDVLLMVTMTATLVLVALAMAVAWPR
jgi:hypothetical protein